MTDSNVLFPCRTIPTDPHSTKLLGLYAQRQEGLWMQRVRIPGGVLTADQWLTLAQITRRFTPHTPLHLTTRQDIELHDLPADTIPAVQQELAGIGLTTLGSGGDTLRNLTVCPCSGLAAGTVDLLPLAYEIQDLLQTVEGIHSLPRKFKISLSACAEGCAQPYINDLGLVARQHGQAWGFEVVAGGSLGARPATGIRVFDWLPGEDIGPLVLAAVRVFAVYGDREHRSRARLRHVRERIGNGPFVSLLQQALDQARRDRPWPAPTLPAADGRFAERATLTFANGDVTPEAADALAVLARRDDLRVRISNPHRVVVFGLDGASLSQALAASDALADARQAQPAVVACPGGRWCSKGLADTNALADRIRVELGHCLPTGTTICISGCPNGCVHSAVAPIGLLGTVASRDGVRTQAYTLLVGGNMGRTEDMAQPMALSLSANEVIRAIRQYARGELAPPDQG